MMRYYWIGANTWSSGPDAFGTGVPAGAVTKFDSSIQSYYFDWPLEPKTDPNFCPPKLDPASPPDSKTPPVNDYVCTRCGNKKCSKTEKSCWSCGEAIPKEDHGSDPCCANPELSGYNGISFVPTILR